MLCVRVNVMRNSLQVHLYEQLHFMCNDQRMNFFGNLIYYVLYFLNKNFSLPPNKFFLPTPLYYKIKKYLVKPVKGGSYDDKHYRTTAIITDPPLTV